MARGSTSKTVVWILMALLILGLGGFGVTNFSGRVRSVGSVGEAEISTAAYGRALQDEIRAAEAQLGQPLPFSRARDMQLDQVALARLVARAALDNEAARLGISAGDANLRDQLLQIDRFKGIDGKFDREAYRFYLDRTGQSEAEFEAEARADIARGLLQAAVLTGIRGSETYANTLLGYLAERRDFTWAQLGPDDLAAPLPEPTEDDLARYHAEHAERFTLPERKRITYAWLTPDMILDQVEVDEDALRKAYEAGSDTFNQPERRLVERLVFPDAAAAEAAKIAIERGDKGFEDIVADRGLDLSDIDLGDVAKPDLGAAGDAVFSAEPGTVVGPFETDLGPALFRVNGVLAAHSMSFEEALPTLREELALDRARRVVDTMRTDIDDLLAAGATLEDIAQETDMTLGTIDWTSDSTDDAAAYEAFRDEATKVAEGDFPALFALDDGGIAALRLDAVLPPELQPLDTVRDAVAEAWAQDETARRLAEQARALVARIGTDTDLATLGLAPNSETGITRQDFIPDTPPDFLQRVFEMQPGETSVLEIPGGAIIIRLDALNPPDLADPDIAALRNALLEQDAAGEAQDVFQYFIADAESRGGLSLDQRAINAVNANFQ